MPCDAYTESRTPLPLSLHSHFRLLYAMGTFFPVYGALYYVYGRPWQVYDRIDLPKKEVDGEMVRDEEYKLVESFPNEPTTQQITRCFG